ncbi:unnamed protein product [Lactuca virosa]|uniref:CCHC-type domain-containing protein n=1 Tax=Lactuca virosa TaxID=75947 RepID=A0AAU9P6G7_9ASTR|nr:unnamed protein product [Lactuca virosa]
MSDSSASKDFDSSKKYEKEGPKCFNCGGAHHFARKCKLKRVDTSKDLEVKYKKLLAFLKRWNIDVKIFVAKVENWVDDEESSDEDKVKDKCLMAHTDATINDEGSNELSSFKANIAKAAKESKMRVGTRHLCIT